jgi:hypothetical protein
MPVGYKNVPKNEASNRCGPPLPSTAPTPGSSMQVHKQRKLHRLNVGRGPFELEQAVARGSGRLVKKFARVNMPVGNKNVPKNEASNRCGPQFLCRLLLPRRGAACRCTSSANCTGSTSAWGPSSWNKQWPGAVADSLKRKRDCSRTRIATAPRRAKFDDRLVTDNRLGRTRCRPPADVRGGPRSP